MGLSQILNATDDDIYNDENGYNVDVMALGDEADEEDDDAGDSSDRLVEEFSERWLNIDGAQGDIEDIIRLFRKRD
ncbi:hypothetical protein PINS_up016959 [Pythium insidiosum]|nr:hypothetical protein PINS_up016959 [Pythium insidiosum]